MSDKLAQALRDFALELLNDYRGDQGMRPWKYYAKLAENALAEHEAAKVEPAPELTDEELLQAIRQCGAGCVADWGLKFARAVIAAHEQKRGVK